MAWLMATIPCQFDDADLEQGVAGSRHGVAEADMLHAVEYRIAIFPLDDGTDMYVGPACADSRMTGSSLLTRRY
jgi:hypothetical protein